MNVQDIFTSRDKNFVKLNIAQDYLSRLLRENMTIFNFDSYKKTATFLTEADRLIKCSVDFEDGGVILSKFDVGTVDDIFSDDRVDEQVSKNVTSFINNINSNEYGTANMDLNSVFEAFKGRSEISRTRAILHKKMERFGDSHKITNCESYAKIMEMKDKFVKYVSENKDALMNYEDVINSVKLSRILGNSFDAEKMDIEDFKSQKSIFVDYNTNKSVYELICQQELIASELVESKENFSRTWVNNDAIHKLASCLYADKETIAKTLEEAIRSVPYLALATKASIKEALSLVYESTNASITKKDTKEFTSKIFEMKKPVKEAIIDTLNEKYGINVQNLRFLPSFTNLAKAQSVFFETIASTAKDNPVLRDTLKEFSNVLHKKTGIQTLDVNDFITEVLSESGLIDEEPILKTVNLGEVVEAQASKVDRELGDDTESSMELDDEAADDDVKKLDGEEKEEKDSDGEPDAEEEEVEDAGLNDSEMKDMMKELETLFKDIDFEDLKKDEDEGGEGAVEEDEFSDVDDEVTEDEEEAVEGEATPATGADTDSN
jgi:hypothetical protein